MGVILDKLETCSKKYTMVEILKFKSFLEECSVSEILNEFKVVIIEPVKGTEFARRFILNTSLSLNDLRKLKTDVEEVLDKMQREQYGNMKHIATIEEICRIIDSKLINYRTLSTADILITNMYIQELEASTPNSIKYGKLLKSILDKEVSDSNKIQMLDELITELKECKFIPNTVQDIENVITLSSIFIATASDVLNDNMLKLLLQIPMNIVLNLRKCDGNIPAKYAYLTSFNLELNKIDSAFISGYQSDYIILYKQNLSEAIATLRGLGVDCTTEKVIESVTYSDSLSKSSNDLDLAILENFYKFVFSENETIEESVEWFNNIVKLSNAKEVMIEDFVENTLDLDFVTEGAKMDKARKKINVGANKIKSKVQKVKDKSRKNAQAAQAAANHISKAGKSMDNAATKAVNKAKGVYRNDIRGEIIEDKTTVKLGRIIRKGILVGTLALVNPALGAIGALTTMALRKKVKDKERRKIIRELEEELEIVNEKIEDAKGDADKEKKYQLMRIRNTLQKDIERIRYRMKADDKGV